MKKKNSKQRTTVKFILKKMRTMKKTTMAIYVCLSLLTAAMSVLIALREKIVLDLLTKNYAGAHVENNVLLMQSIILGSFMLVLAICELSNQYISSVFSLRYKKKYLLENVDRFSSLKMEVMEGRNAHFLFDMSCVDTNIDPFTIMKPAMTIVTTLVTIIMYFAILIKFNMIVAILPILLAIPLFLLGQKKELYEYRSKYDGEIMDLDRRITYFTSVIKEPLYAKENTVYNIGKFFLKKRQGYKNSLVNKKMSYMAKTVDITILISLFTFFAQYSLYFVLGINVLKDGITLGSLNLYFNAFTAILLSINGIIDSCGYIQAQVRLDGFKQQFLELPTIDNGRKKITAPKRGKHTITFENVTFAYPDTSRNIIQNLSFTINEGDAVALIGENGCGKSTLIKLLIGQYEAQEGRILIDGIDIRDYSVEALSSIYGVMFQNIEHLAVPIHEYIAFSDDRIDEKRLHDAIGNADCNGIIENSIAGENTIMGLELYNENAKEFSGGEWQKFAMARLLYANSDIFVMDEPTAALDAEAEYNFFEKMKTLGYSHQIVMVSHRLSIAKLCSKIIYFDVAGVTVDTHDNLILRSETYKNLYNMQRSMYFSESKGNDAEMKERMV